MAQLPDGLIFEYELDHKEISITATQRELVKCKHCKNYLPEEPCVGGFYEGCNLFEGRDGCPLEINADFFCAYGERKEEP